MHTPSDWTYEIVTHIHVVTHGHINRDALPFKEIEKYVLAIQEEAKLEGAKNTEQQLQPENGKKLCAVEYCKYWERGACASENKCIGVSVSG